MTHENLAADPLSFYARRDAEHDETIADADASADILDDDHFDDDHFTATVNGVPVTFDSTADLAAYFYRRGVLTADEATAAGVDLDNLPTIEELLSRAFFSVRDYVRTEWGAGRQVSDALLDRARRETLGSEFSS